MQEEDIVRAILERLQSRGLVLEEFGGRLVLTSMAVGRALFPCTRKVALEELKTLLREYGIIEVVDEVDWVEVDRKEVERY